MPQAQKNPVLEFETDNQTEIGKYKKNIEWQCLTSQWMKLAFENRYMYHFSFMGRPVIQTPPDMVAVQELIWQVKPDLIIETGIAHGGSLIMSAGMLALLDYSDAVANKTVLDPQKPQRRVLGIDIDIREHNRKEILAHPMAGRIDMIEGSSISAEVIAKVSAIAAKAKTVLVFLDSNHTHDHVLAELEAYAPLATKGSYCVVFDTIVEDLPDDSFPDRPWGQGNNPKTAVWEYLRLLSAEGRMDAKHQPLHFENDKMLDDKLLMTVSPEGFLKRV